MASTNIIYLALALIAITLQTLQQPGVEGVPDEPDDVVDDEKEGSQPQSRMHNGHNTGEWEYPWVAAISANGDLICTGALLPEGRVLTAAHCFTNLNGFPIVNANNLFVTFGSRRFKRAAPLRPPPRLSYIVKDIFRYSNKRTSTPGAYHDIAILQLRATPPIAPYEVLDVWPSPGEARVLGWGDIDIAGSQPAALQTQLVDIKDDFVGCPCHNFFELCAEARSGKLCVGDSGGPLIKWEAGRFGIVGVTSRGWDGCSAGNTQTIFTKTRAYIHWINNPVAAVDNNNYVDRTCPRRLDENEEVDGGRQLSSSEGDGGDSGDDGSGCFPGTSMVHIQNHPDPVAISSLQPGDEVLTLSSSGQLIYSPFISYLHKQPSTHTQYLTIHTQHNHTLHVSHNHLLYKANIQNQVTDHDFAGSYVFAGDVSVGDALIGLSDAISVTIVTSIDSSSMVGVYAPLTDAGTIVVDGVFASCYATSPYQNVNHLGTLPYRMWVKVTRAWYGDGAKGEDDQVMPPYIELLYHYALPALLSF